MEISLQEQKFLKTPIQSNKFKSKNKASVAAATGGHKFVGVRQRPSGRWVAEIKDTTQKIRMWLGTFETAEDAARAYDEAACLLRGTNTRTNFSTRHHTTISADSADSPLANRIRKLLHHKKLASNSSSNRRLSTSPAVTNSASVSSTSSAGGSKQGSPATSEHYQEVCQPSFVADFELGSSLPELSPLSSWAFDAFFNGFEMSRSIEFADTSTEAVESYGCNACSMAAEVSVFEKMTVERQISASLYAMNGVQEYFEAVQDLSSSSALIDPAWDLPPLYHFY